MSSYKDTLNLPKTEFPMKAGLTTREPEILARWERQKLYERIQEARKDATRTYILHDGPPFANGDVHMGTALNKILKDFVVKSRTMAGYRAPYVPGWDCHGLPIEFKVVKESKGLAPAEVRRRSEAYARKFIDSPDQLAEAQVVHVVDDVCREQSTHGIEVSRVRVMAVEVDQVGDVGAVLLGQ